MIFRLRFALILLLLILVFSFGLFLGRSQKPIAQNPPLITTLPAKIDTTILHKVTKVVDGDTVELSDGRRVRYLDIDTPEIGQPFANEAKNFNAQLVLNKEVRLQFDAGPQKDKYGRLLAYVWIDQIFINERLLEEGLAKVFILNKNSPTKYETRLRAAETTAQKSALGLWQKAWVN